VGTEAITEVLYDAPGIGLWLDNSGGSASDTVDRILASSDDALVQL
jgi:hypothetical protein